MEVHSVEGLPMDVKRMLGRQKAGVEGLADKWEPFNKTDVIDARLPMRRFTTGGAGPSSALLAYEQGGRGYSVHAAAFYAELQKLNDRFPLCANSQADRGDR